MARRRLTPEKETQLAAEAESRRGDTEEWDFDRPLKIARGGRPTAVVSVRVPLPQMKELRRLAAQEGISLSRLLQDAIDCYVARPRSIQLHFAEVERFFAFNVAPEQTSTDPAAPSLPSIAGGPSTLTSARGTPLRVAS